MREPRSDDWQLLLIAATLPTARTPQGLAPPIARIEVTAIAGPDKTPPKMPLVKAEKNLKWLSARNFAATHVPARPQESRASTKRG